MKRVVSSLCMMLLSSCINAAIEVHFRDNVTLDAHYLGDVISIVGEHRALQQRIDTMVIPVAISEGQTIYAHDVEYWLANALHRVDIQLHWPAQTHVVINTHQAHHRPNSKAVLSSDSSPIVVRGQSVSAMVTQGSIRISIRAKALHSGAMGDRIQVENNDSHDVFYARITGAQRVEVQS